MISLVQTLHGVSLTHIFMFDNLSIFKKNKRERNIRKDLRKYILYKGATARVQQDNHVSEPFAIERGVRQGDPISPKLFTAVIEEIFKKADLDKGINRDGERLQNLGFADDVALVTKTTKEMEEHLNKLNTESKKIRTENTQRQNEVYDKL